MKIRKLKIEHFGSIQCFEAVFRADLIVLCGVYSDQVALAIRLLVGGRMAKRDKALFSQATALYAEIECDDVFCVEITKADTAAEPHYTVHKQSDHAECTDEYLNLISQSIEEEAFNTFSYFKKCNYPHRIKQYKHIETYYPNNEFGALTDGVGKTRAFRAELNRFIRDFKPERLRKDKEYWLTLNDKGEFKVIHSAFGVHERPYLSETEKILYHYLCFLHLSEFWSEVEKIRNINHVDKPLIITDFIERIDRTVNLSEYVARTRELGRQIVLVVSCKDGHPSLAHMPNKQIIHIEEKRLCT